MGKEEKERFEGMDGSVVDTEFDGVTYEVE